MERHVCLTPQPHSNKKKTEASRRKHIQRHPNQTKQTEKMSTTTLNTFTSSLDHRWTILLHSPSRKSVSTSTKVKIPDMNELEAFHLDKMDSSSPMPFLLLRRRCCCCRSLDSSDNGPFTPPCPLFFFPTTAVPSTNVLPPNEKRKDKGCKRKR